MLCLHLSIWYWFSTLENLQLTWTCLDCTGNKQDLKTFWERKKLLIKIDFNHWSQLQIINNVLAQALWVSPWRLNQENFLCEVDHYSSTPYCSWSAKKVEIFLDHLLVMLSSKVKNRQSQPQYFALLRLHLTSLIRD